MNFEERNRLYSESGQSKICPTLTPLERTLSVIIGILVVIGIALTIALSSKGTAKTKLEEKQSEICLSPECIYEASNLLKSVDFSVDPCEDFYQFACGNWIKNTYLIGEKETQFTRLTVTILLRVKNLLEELESQTNLTEHQKKTSEFYKACMNKVHREDMGVDPLKSDLKFFGGWPLASADWDDQKFDWVKLMVELFKTGYISNMLLTVRVDHDTMNTTQPVILIGSPSLGLKRPYFLLSDDDTIEKYKEVISKLAKLINKDLEDKDLKENIDKAFDIEKRLAKAAKEVNMRDAKYFYHVKSLEELEEFAPTIPWKRLLQSLLPTDTTLNNDEKIMITNLNYIKDLDNILQEIESRKRSKDLANYMLYRAALFAGQQLSTEMFQLINGIVDKNSYSLWQICTKTTMELFDLSVTASYIKKYVDKAVKSSLKTMVDDIRDALIDEIRLSKWLDDETRKNALFKVENMKAAIAYREEIMNDEKLDEHYNKVEITEDHFSNAKNVVAFRMGKTMEGLNEEFQRFEWSNTHNLLTANAYYQPDQNAIIIPVGLLQETVFALSRPNYINYGSLGMISGHELTHAFDGIGGLYDAYGNYRMWWTKASWINFLKKAECFANQYSQYYSPKINATVNGTLTLAENIADNGGLKAAYSAYNKMLIRNGPEKRLPGFSYSERQMFWISFASVWCRKQTEDSMLDTMEHSLHTPAQFRIIGTVSNIKEFSEDYNCKLGSPMNPSEKCSLWK